MTFWLAYIEQSRMRLEFGVGRGEIEVNRKATLYMPIFIVLSWKSRRNGWSEIRFQMHG